MSAEKKPGKEEQARVSHEQENGIIKVNVEVPAWLYPDGGLYIYVGTSNPPTPPGS